MTTPFSLSPSPSPFPSPSPSPSPSEDEKPGWYPFLGLFIYILGTILMSGGVNIQKFALNKAKKRCEERGEKVHGGWKSPLWFLGLTCYIFAGIFLSVALYFATPALVTPFMSVVLISNLIFAHFLLGEPLTKKDGIAISIVIVGLIVTAVTAPEDSQVHKSKDLIGFYKEIPFIIFASLICLCLIVLIVLNILLQKQVRNCIIPSKEMEPWKLFMYPFSFASLAGIFGGTTVLIMKSAIEIIVEKMSHGFVPFISSWFMYVLVLLMGFFWSMQMFWLNRGLKYFHAIYIVSLEAVINELVAVVGSIIYFQEYNEKNFTTVKKVFFCVGMSIGVFGVLLLAYWRREFDDEPNLLDMNPEEWMDRGADSIANTRMSVKTSRQSMPVIENPPGRQHSAPQFGSDGLEEQDEEETQLPNTVLASPSPFSPSPLLAVSLWGIPKTPKMRIRHRRQQDISAVSTREMEAKEPLLGAEGQKQREFTA